MNSTSRTIFIISGDLVLAQRCVEELAAFGGRYRTLVVGRVDKAWKRIGRSAPAAVFLDESAIDIAHDGETLESALEMLTEAAPVILAAAPEKQSAMAFLITSGAVDFVARTGNFLPIVAGMMDRRVRVVERGAGMSLFSNDQPSRELGQILRSRW